MPDESKPVHFITCDTVKSRNFLHYALEIQNLLRATFALILAFSIYVCLNGPSADFLASWMAGNAWMAGNLDSIYPSHSNLFDLLAPPEWYAELIPASHKGEVYPFIYPPIWAVVMGHLSTIVSYETLRIAVSVLNPLMLAGCVLLAIWISGRNTGQLPLIILGFIILVSTMIGKVALLENQPQIFVAFLTLLAVERAQAGKPLAAGTALAIAAALKLYPAFFIVIFIVAGYRRASLSFLGVGLFLGLLSVALAGWELHIAFLQTISMISESVLLTQISWSFDQTIAQVFFIDQMPLLPRPEWAYLAPEYNTEYLRVLTLAKPPLWQVLSTLLMLVSLVASALLYRYAKRINADAFWTWPISFGLAALTSPLSWPYYYIAAVAFAPLLLGSMGKRQGMIILIIVFVPLTATLLPVVQLIPWPANPLQLVGTLSMCILTISYFIVLLRSSRKPCHT